VRVLNLGALRYADHNWELVEGARDRYFDALMRHAVAWYEGERDDPDFGTHHLANACCCALFLLSLDTRRGLGPARTKRIPKGLGNRPPR
jgi:hypothetical protein